MNEYWFLNSGITWKQVTKQDWLNMKYRLTLPEYAHLGDISDMFKVVRGQNKPNRKHNKGKLFKGVSKCGNKYQARFEDKYLGRFALDTDAARAYDDASIAKYGDKAVTNFTRR